MKASNTVAMKEPERKWRLQKGTPARRPSRRSLVQSRRARCTSRAAADARRVAAHSLRTATSRAEAGTRSRETRGADARRERGIQCSGASTGGGQPYARGTRHRA